MKFSKLAEAFLDGARAPLYHFTDNFRAISILSMNGLGEIDYSDYRLLTGKHFVDSGVVCLTRDKKYKVRGSATTVCFALDGEKLTQAFKLRQHVDFSAKNNRSRNLGGDREEAEERIRGVIRPLDKYLLNIYISDRGYNELKMDYESMLSIINKPLAQHLKEKDAAFPEHISATRKEEKMKQYADQFVNWQKNLKVVVAEKARLLFHPKLKKGLP